MSVSLSFDGNLHDETELVFMLPKDSYTLPDNSPLTLLTEDSSYYYIVTEVECTDPAKICLDYQFSQTFTVTNKAFLKNQRNSLMFYAQYDDIYASETFSTLVSPFVPGEFPELAFTRSSNTAADDT